MAYLPSGVDVAVFLGRVDDQTLAALAHQHVDVVTAMCRSYTRGNGFYDGREVADDLAAVILTATARLVGNPEQHRADTVGPFASTHTVGWTIAETFVLNRYRKRAA